MAQPKFLLLINGMIFLLSVLQLYTQLKSNTTHSNPSYAMALTDSNGFFDDITDESWKLLKQRVKERTNHHIGPMHLIDNSAAWYQENFEPDFTCTHERRIGIPATGDGPKWVCDPHRLKTQDCLVYSAGSNGDFSFEEGILDLIGPHCEVHTFDPEMTGSKYSHLVPEGIHYHAWGFMGEQGSQAQQNIMKDGDSSQGNFKTMKQTVEELGHIGRSIDIFKIDCEGCEWYTFNEWFNAGATPKQILVEVHYTPQDRVNEFFLFIQENGYVTFHKEPNIQHAGGECVEYAFLKLEKSFFEDQTNPIKISHDPIKQLKLEVDTKNADTDKAQARPNTCLLNAANVRDIKLYSQNDEDGAILQVLRCMGGHGTKEYFEFGSENGMEVNSRILREVYGWNGHLLDGGHEDPSIPLHKEYFTPSNIVSLLEKYSVSKSLDLLSIDCDYDDFWVMREILLEGYKPRVLITEYNSNFGTEWAVSTVAKPIEQEGEIRWNHDCYFGASAQAFFILGKAFGYTPVWTNTVNIIFVREDLATSLGLTIPPAENFPGPYDRALHHECSGKTWKSIDTNHVAQTAADKDVSHVDFAGGFSDVKLECKTFTNPGKSQLSWRAFHKVE